MFKKILVPVDLTETELSQWALEVALELGKAGESALRVINVQAPSRIYFDYVPIEIQNELRVSVEEQISTIVSGMDYPLERLSTAFRLGSVYHEVLAEATEWDADLIIVGSHRPSMATYLIGSNAKTIVRHAKCSVLVVRK